MPSHVDLTISNEIKCSRHTTNYGNEYLYGNKIGVDKIKSVDIRLLEYLESNTSFVESIINKYNSLKDIAIALKQLDLDIPLREMSSQNITMDVDKLLETPKILIKK